MIRHAGEAPTTLMNVPGVPAWAVPRGPVECKAEAAFMAGSALTSLDSLVRSEPAWLGAWRHRLALKAAAATAQLMRHGEDEAALRDAWYLRKPGDALGPAGEVLLAWRKLASRSFLGSAEDIGVVAELLGNKAPNGLESLLIQINDHVCSGAPAFEVAARAGAAILREDPEAEALAWWLTDLCLSWRMGWSPCVPLLAGQMFVPALRTGPDRRRGRPSDPEFARVVCLAAASGTAEACRIAASMANQAERLEAVRPKLRAKGAGEVIALLLSDDAVSGSFTSKAMTRWASRRLFERLESLDAVGELTGRSTFRLYGL